MRHLDLAELGALAAEVAEVETAKALELLGTAEVRALLAPALPRLVPHEAAARLVAGLVALAPLPVGSRRLAVLAGLHLLAVNGLDAELDPTSTRDLLAGVAAGRHDAASVAAWLDPLVTARDPIEGELAELLSVDAWWAIGLALLRAHRHGRRKATPGDLLLGLFREGRGPAALALGAQGQPGDVLAHPPRPHVPEGIPALEPEVRKVLELALRASVTLGHEEVNGGHLLLGLLDAGHAAVLPDGLDAAGVRRRTLELLGPGASPDGDLAARVDRLAARLRTSDPAAAAELDEVADLQRVGLDRLVEMVRAWRGEIFLEAMAGDDAVVRLVGRHRLAAQASAIIDERLLAKYVTDIQRYPELTRDEEAALAATMAAGSEAEAAESRLRMVQANLRLVVTIAKKLDIPRLSMLDRIQEGNLGLLRAAERYDPTKGFRFTTFATWWIRDAILDASRRP